VGVSTGNAVAETVAGAGGATSAWVGRDKLHAIVKPTQRQRNPIAFSFEF
jgi:hypothetical protein